MRNASVHSGPLGRWGRRLCVVAGLFGAVACKSDDESLIILAASSLTYAFDELATRFRPESSEPSVSVGYAGSQIVRLQVEEGAVADVVAVADLTALEDLSASGIVREVSCLAQNELVVAVSESAPPSLRRFEDLPHARRLVIGVEDSPIGRYTREAFRRAEARWPGFRDRLQIVSEEPNVRLVLSKIALGEADAAVVYRTDVQGVRGVRSVSIAREFQMPIRYGIGVVATSERLDLGREFIALATSPKGTATLRDHRFATHPCR